MQFPSKLQLNCMKFSFSTMINCFEVNLNLFHAINSYGVSRIASIQTRLLIAHAIKTAYKKKSKNTHQYFLQWIGLFMLFCSFFVNFFIQSPSKSIETYFLRGIAFTENRLSVDGMYLKQICQQQMYCHFQLFLLPFLQVK